MPTYRIQQHTLDGGTITDVVQANSYIHAAQRIGVQYYTEPGHPRRVQGPENGPGIFKYYVKHSKGWKSLDRRFHITEERG